MQIEIDSHLSGVMGDYMFWLKFADETKMKMSDLPANSQEHGYLSEILVHLEALYDCADRHIVIGVMRKFQQALINTGSSAS